MIPNHELTEGSIVGYKYWNPHPEKPSWEIDPVEVLGFLKKDIYFKANGNKRISKIQELHPIRMSAWWFEKFGFEKEIVNDGDVDIVYYKKDGIKYVLNILGGISVSGVFSHYIERPKHVHMFQNLHFALSGVFLKKNSNGISI